MSLQIFILGMLSEGEHHPYDIKKMILKPLENTVSINDGTLYYNFEVLLKKGLIKKLQVVQSDNRPEKTTYGITDKGRIVLEEEIYDVFKKFNDIRSLYSSLMFLDKVDPHKLAYVIEEAIARLEKRVSMIEGSDPELLEVPEEKREAVSLIVEHANQTFLKDIDWLHKLLASVRKRAGAE
ncbi:PadR family transcriptional regulator [Paenibacillus sp. GCM10012306]|uniref:PadR family transcriptional regulator n=1 Tax=Paenibacillus sp. GCM10012306 TaxID=3317342 RepID=UPI003620A3C2